MTTPIGMPLAWQRTFEDAVYIAGSSSDGGLVSKEREETLWHAASAAQCTFLADQAFKTQTKARLQHAALAS
jgi:hypothetical protein